MPQSQSDRIRVLLAKPGLEGQDTRTAALARAFRGNGMEVVYLGVHQTPRTITRCALDEDVDVVALSVLSGVPMMMFPAVADELAKAGLDVLLTGEGRVSEAEKGELARMGVDRVFDPDSPAQEIIDYIRTNL